jgi:uncharacterized protein (TIGR02284 family)
MFTMTTSAGRPKHRRAIAVLNRLILACNDGARAQRAAALVVQGSGRKARLEDSAERHVAFSGELTELVTGLGGVPGDGGSMLETIRIAGRWINVLLVGDNSGDAYGTCVRIEAGAEKLYEKATQADLPGAARLVVARHHAGIVADHVELRRFSMGG